ncbi:hypothetical protein [Ralstonia holmesii]|uniref:hypothetical protein n=1 Tax=Ralstonia holmesii TaxID=3058602 RepID=UPI003F189962
MKIDTTRARVLAARVPKCAVAALALVGASAALAQLPASFPVKSYAQELVDRTVAQHPDLRAVVMHVTPPNAADNVVIASNIGRIGKPADADDLDVIATGNPHVAMDQGNKRIEIELPLRDVGGQTVGSLGLVWRYPVGGNHAEFERIAGVIRDALSRRILSLANLMDPYPFAPLVTTKSRAQTLVEEALQRHPEVTVLALRARVQPKGDLVLLGSTFGRHGKKADADDMKVLDATAPITGVYSNGKRFGVDLPIRNRSGIAIGTLNVGYAYGSGQDAKALTTHAVALRDELQTRIAATPALEEIDP